MELQRGALPIKLDKPRKLFFDMASFWLLHKKYGRNPISGLCQSKLTGRTLPADADHPEPRPERELELVDIEALQYFLWAALQADAKENGEVLTYEQVGQILQPWNYEPLFYAVVEAWGIAMRPPAEPGKAQAPGSPEPQAPKSPGPTKVSTSMKRSGSRSGRSGGPRSTSGR